MRSFAQATLLASTLGCAPELLPPTGGDATGSTGGVDGTGTDATGAETSPTGLEDESSSGGEPTVPPTGLCLHGTMLSALPDGHVPVAVVDNDGDGRDELWAVDNGAIAVLQSSDAGAIAVAATHVVDASVGRMADVDGDGLHDVLVLADGGQAAWIEAMPGLELGTDLTPLGVASLSHSTWIDLDGDGAVDFVELLPGADISEPGGLRVRMGDGAGGFVPGQELWAEFPLLSIGVYDTGIPGQPVLRMEEYDSEWGGSHDIIAVQMKPDGLFDIVARRYPVYLEVAGAGDFDGNGVPDLVGSEPLSGADVILVQGQADGGFEISAAEASSEHMMVDEFDGDDAGRVDLLYWDAAEVWLRRGTGEGFSAPEPVTRTGAMGRMNTGRAMQADGSGGHEVVVQMSGDNIGYALQVLGPCG